MPKNPKILLLAALCALGLSQAFAQSATPAPADATQAGPYRSAFEGYRPFAAEEVQPWRQSNDTAREIGGWRAYAREISGAGSPSGSPPQGQKPAVDAPKPAHPHAGHAKP